MDLKLTVDTGDGPPSDVAARIPAGSLCGDLALALARHLRLGRPSAGERWVLFSHRGQRWLHDLDEVALSGLQNGDALSVTGAPGVARPQSSRPGVGGVTVTFTTGWRAGQTIALPVGEHTLGREPTAAIHIDDPYAASKHAVISVERDRVLLTDLGSTTGTEVDGRRLSGSRALRSGQLVTIGGSTLAIGAAAAGVHPPLSTTGEVLFNRPPRVIRVAEPSRHRLQAPPADPAAVRLPLVAALLPLIVGGVMYALIRSPVALVFLAMSPLMALGSYIERRMTASRTQAGERAEFKAAVEALAGQVEIAVSEERRRRQEAAPPLRTLAVAAYRRDSWLWERRPKDVDFLELRVAVANLPSGVEIDFAEGGSKALGEAARARLAPFAEVSDVPLTVQLAELGVAGLAGTREPVAGLARWLVLQAATLQSPRNLSICAALPREEAADWDWLKWLPHTAPQAAQFEGPSLCATAAAGRGLLQRLVTLMDARATAIGPYRATSTRATHPHVLALIHEEVRLPRAELTRLLTDGPRMGIVILWIGTSSRQLPNECQAVLEVDAQKQVRLTLPAAGKVVSGTGGADSAGVAEARQVALELAPLRDTSAGDIRGQLPREVGLLELLALSPRPSAAEIAGRWSAGPNDLSAPIGVASSGSCVIDLRRDGPHGLVGGTTGAGKSELLQALVGALAASHSPRSLNFLLVDYKGGSAFKDAARLPHTVGLVTDLDGHLTRRAMVSLRAELRRREQVLRESGARDLGELERRGTGIAPPSLVIIVDEFATLAREVPEFVEGVVDLAQRGRSLGLHVLLATQRPAGVINDNIRANTNLRISLRMNEEAESVDFIGAPDAAWIPRSWPGRALARTGHQELTELQVAYAGLSSRSASDTEAIEVAPFPITGPAFRQRPAPSADAAEDTDLNRLVTAIVTAHAGLRGIAAPRPWLPELPSLLPWKSLAATSPPSAAAVPMGLLDEPERQVQTPWRVDLEAQGNLLVFGTNGSGKTSVLRTLAHGLAVANSPSRLHLFGLDCAGGGLAAIRPLPHCGAYVRVDEVERVARLVRWLRGLVDTRRAAAQELGDEAGPGPARVVVLLDGYPGFVAAMEKVDFGEAVDALPRLVADGPAVGVHFVITADRRAGVPSAVTALVPGRLVLRMADDDEYRNAGLATEAFAGARLAAGRGFIEGGTEVQCAVLGRDGGADAQARALRQAGDAARARFGAAPVPAIQLLPVHVDGEDLPAAPGPWTAVVGLEDGTTEGGVMDFQEDGQLVVGPPHSGRSSALLMAVESLRRSTPGLCAVLLAPRRSPLAEVGPWAEVARGRVQCEDLAARLAADVRESDEETADPSILVVIDDGEELLEGAVAGHLDALARRARDHGYRILAAVETRAAQRSYDGWVVELRKARRGLLLQPDVDIDGDLLGARLARRTNQVFPPGRGFLVRRGVAELVQVGASTAP